MAMELSRITKLLLWLLSKRDDIGQIALHEADAHLIEMPSEEYQALVADLLGDDDSVDGMTAQQVLEFDRDHLTDCFNAPSADKSI